MLDTIRMHPVMEIKRHGLYVLALASLVLLSVILPCQSSQYSQSILSYGLISHTLSWLHTDGKYIKDSLGNVVRLRGVATWNPAVTLHDWWPPLDKIFNERLVALHPNVLRLGIGTDNFPAYAQDLDWIVNFCKANNIRIIWDCHTIGHYENGYTRPKNVWSDPALKEEWIDWLVNVAAYYRNEPTVCGIGLLNEPDWDQLNTPETFLTWKNAATEAIDRIHAINPNLLIFVAGAGGVYEWDRFYTEPFINRPNIVFEAHLYPNYLYSEWISWGEHPWIQYYVTGDFETGWAEMQRILENGGLDSEKRLFGIRENLPIYIGEIGLPYKQTEDGTPIPDYTPFPNAMQVYLDLIRFFNKHEFHYTQYAYDWGSTWGIINEDGTPRNIYMILSEEWKD